MALYGVYGSHTVDSCPVNNLEVAKAFVAFAEADPTPMLRKHGIREVLGQYHSAFEHTFIWIVDADDPHQVEEFALAISVPNTAAEGPVAAEILSEIYRNIHREVCELAA